MQMRLITDYLNNSAEKYPNKLAFIDSARSLTFSELRNESFCVAQEIINLNLFKVPVAIYLKKSVECISSFMGVAYSGNFYTPIDVDMPSDRIEKILDSLKPRLIITDSKHKQAIDSMVSGIPIIVLDKIKNNVFDEASVIKVSSKIIDTDLLYVLFTSGSTGIPKGVVVSHKSVVAYSEWFSTAFNITKDDIFGNQTPFYFSMSVTDIFQTLKNSCTLYIIPKLLFSFPIKLLNFLNEKKITTIYWVPSVLILIVNLKALGKIDISCLKKILFAGEVMPTRYYNIWKKNVSTAMFANLFGPTEVTDICSYYLINRDLNDDEAIPIGVPCNNCDCLVLNEQNKQVVNETGELYVRGSFLAYGYYNNFEKTNSVFMQNPLNANYPELVYKTGDLIRYNEFGEMVYVGRKDSQIKHMGHRIELGEIETAISSISGVDENCCLYNSELQKIYIFYSGRTTIMNLLKEVKNLLPTYMVPEKIVQLDCLPHNLNGKIDRVELKKTMEE